MRELERTRKAAISKLAQAEAQLKSAAAQYNVQVRQRKDLDQQIESARLAPRNPGWWFMGAPATTRFYYGGEERIREGATVRERQTIITIPDMTHMAVNVKIHETYIKKIKKGQKARITVDAFADKVLDGEVTKVGVLPDSQNRWMNPDLKVYLTTIAIDGTTIGETRHEHQSGDHGRPAQDVVYVPVQAVVPENGQYVCYLARNAARNGAKWRSGSSTMSSSRSNRGWGRRRCPAEPAQEPRAARDGGGIEATAKARTTRRNLF